METIQFDQLTLLEKKLCLDAIGQLKHAHCPESNIPAGAALCIEEDLTFAGCRIEFRRGSIQAIETALAKMISRIITPGLKHIKTIAFTFLTDKDSPRDSVPAMRSIYRLEPFSSANTTILGIRINQDNQEEIIDIQVHALKELLPQSFASLPVVS